MVNYLIVLFKNKKRKRIINKFVTYTKAKSFYDKLVKDSEEVIFELRMENGTDCEYELGLIELSGNKLLPIYLTDELGRNVRVRLDDDSMSISNISKYKIEDKIFDTQTNKKITTQEFISKYLKGDGIKMISVLNNKIILQKNEETFIFSLKSELESTRFVDCLSLQFFRIKRADCLFIKDCSKTQRKYLYDLLESFGFDKKKLYRKYTTYPTPSK